MHPNHYHMLRGLSRCSFLPGSFAKRFVRDLSGLGPYDMLSPKQEATIENIALHFRRQLNRNGYALPDEWLGRLAGEPNHQPTPKNIKRHWVKE